MPLHFPSPAEVFKYGLDNRIVEWRPNQVDALMWAAKQGSRFLIINAPTGSGKTLIGAGIAEQRGDSWSYLVATNALQEQVSATFNDAFEQVKGRSHFPCWIDPDIDASEGICVMGESCEYDDGGKDKRAEDMCPYYEQVQHGRDDSCIVNYPMSLKVPSLVKKDLLICDEAHGIEEQLINTMEVTLTHSAYRRYGGLFKRGSPFEVIKRWCEEMYEAIPHTGAATIAEFKARDNVRKAMRIREDWLINWGEWGVRLSPLMGWEFADELWGDASTVILMSATMLGMEYIADSLALPPGSWAYLDMPSTFPVENRPIYYQPVVRMNYRKGKDPVALQKMQDGIDDVIERYVRERKPWGLIHAVSNARRDEILTRSRWRAIMVTDDAEHARRVAKKQPSVLVAANRMEGWDGADDLCRFIIMPKIPFPSLGDPRVRARMDADARSYDYATLVQVVQGVGRGVRSETDSCDTWILDGAWAPLYARRREWLPDAFQSAYQHVR